MLPPSDPRVPIKMGSAGAPFVEWLATPRALASRPRPECVIPASRGQNGLSSVPFPPPGLPLRLADTALLSAVFAARGSPAMRVTGPVTACDG